MGAGFVAVAGGQLHYDVQGSGSPVAFIPGFTLDTRMWDSQLAAFSARHLVIRYDLRGAGRSDPPDGPYSHEEDLATLLDHLGIETAHLAGLSLGAAIAVDFALAYPERVRSLVLTAPAALGGYPWHPVLAQWFTAIEAAAGQGDMARAKELWLGTGWFLPAMRQPATAARLRAMMASYSGWHFANRNPVRRSPNPANGRLSRIAAPCLVILGELDLPFYNWPLAERLAGEIPGARLLTITNAGHMTNMEAPAAYNRAVLDFLADVDSTRPERT